MIRSNILIKLISKKIKYCKTTKITSNMSHLSPSNMNPKRVQHFIKIQQDNGQQKVAEEELKNGQKCTHWIWYILPNILGLGSSGMCQEYGIKNLEHSINYLENDILINNYMSICTIIHHQLCIKNADVHVLMGSHIDMLKLISSYTLFLFTSKKMLDIIKNSDIDVRKSENIKLKKERLEE